MRQGKVKRLLPVIGAVTLVGFLLLMFWPSSSYDRNKVHPSLRDLEMPLQAVNVEYFMDGGSIGVTLIDCRGRSARFALPVSAAPGPKYPQLLVGVVHSSKPGGVEVASEWSSDTRNCLIECVEHSPTPAPEDDLALIALRGSPIDYARLFGKWVSSVAKGRFSRP